MPVICESGVLPGLLAMLHNGELREQTLDVLLAITSKKTKDAPHAAFCALIQGILEACGPGGLLQSFEYVEHKRLCMILSNFGANHFYTIQGTCKSPCACGESSIREGFLQLMAYFTGYSALSVSEMTASFWRNFLDLQQADSVAKMPPAVQDALLVALSEKLTPPTDDDVDGDEDVADKEELMKLWTQTKAKYLDILKRMATNDPERSVFFVGSRWQAALQAYFAQTGPVNTAAAQDAFEGLTSLFDCSMQGVPSWAFSASVNSNAGQEQTRTQVVGACGMITKMLIDAEAEHEGELVIAAVVFKSLPTLIPYLKEHPQAGAHIVMRLLSLYKTISWNQSDDASRRALVLSARRRISSSVVKIAQALATHLLQHRNDITALAQELLGSNVITSDEVAHIYELLFVLTNPVPSPEEQSKFLHDVMSGPVSEWRSPTNTQVVSGFQAWLHGTEVGGAREGGGGDDPVREHRVKLQSIMMTLLCICRRCVSGGASLKAAAAAGSVNDQVGLILPNLLALTHSVHSVWLPQVKAGVSPAWQTIYRSVEYEVAADPEFRLGDDMVNTPTSEMCTWLRHCRDSAYQLLGMLCTFKVGFFGAIEADPGLLIPLSGHITSMENRHLRSWIRMVITPFAVHCPRHLHDALLGNVIAPVFALAYGRLNEGYGAMMARAGGGGAAGKPAAAAGGGGGERESIVADQVLRLLHREVCDFVLNALGEHPHTVTAKNDDNSGVGGPGMALIGDAINHEELTQYLLGGCGSAAQVLVLTLCSSIEWPDSAGATRASLAIQKMIPKVKGDVRYHSMLAGELLRAIMRGLASGESTTNPTASETLLLHLLREVYVHFAPITPIVDQTLSQLPGITPAALTELRDTVLGSNSEKKQRAHLRDFARACFSNGSQNEQMIMPIQKASFVAKPQGTQGMDGWSDEQREQCWSWLNDVR